MHSTHLKNLKRAGYTILVCASIILITLYLFANDKICFSQTGVAPEGAYFSDSNFFRENVTMARALMFNSLLGQFDTTTGFFIYSEHPNGSRSSENNDIRQLLASHVLAKASHTDVSLHSVHTQNISTIMELWYREEGNSGYVYVDEKSKLGANAMLLRALVASPFFSTYEREASMLTRSIIASMNSDGSFKPWFKEPAYTYDGEYLLTFYSGEAILALLEYADTTGDEETFEVAKKAQDFYIDEYATRIEENFYPAYVPWHTLSLARLYKKTSEEKYANAIFVLNDKLLTLQDMKTFIGRFYNPETPEYGSPHASSDAVYTEGLAIAYEVAHMRGDSEHEERYKHSLIRAFHNLTELQLTSTPFQVFENKEVVKRLEGGLKTNACSRWVRIDSTAHAIDALDNIIDVAKW